MPIEGALTGLPASLNAGEPLFEGRPIEGHKELVKAQVLYSPSGMRAKTKVFVSAMVPSFFS